MELVRSQYEELKDTMATFQVGLSECLAKAEAEFLQAYRAHMLEVHRELQELRDKLSEAETSILGDDQIVQLEKDGAWYRSEAAQQTAYIAVMQKDQEYMQRKAGALDADRRTLGRQLKRAKKQQKLLRAELRLRQTARAHSRQGGPRLPSLAQSPSRSSGQLERSASTPSWLHAGDIPPKVRFQSDIQDSLENPELALKKLKRALVLARKDTARERCLLVTDRARGADFEDFFGLCVADIETQATKVNADKRLPDPQQLRDLAELIFPTAKHHRAVIDQLSPEKAAEIPSPVSPSSQRQHHLSPLEINAASLDSDMENNGAQSPLSGSASTGSMSLALDADTLHYLSSPSATSLLSRTPMGSISPPW